MADRGVHELARALYTGRVDRREFIRRAAALGVSSTAIGLFLQGAAAQDATKVPSPTPIPADAAAPAVASPCAGDSCLFQGQKVTFLCPNESIQVPLFEARDEFEKATGAKLEIVLAPLNDVLPKLLEDVSNETGAYDASIIGAWWLGALVEGEFVAPLEDYRKDTKYPSWDLDAILPGPRALMEYGGTLYQTAYDHDGQVLYYRRDLLTDPTHQAAFKAEAGYDLPVPPQTWDQTIAVAKYFNGKDLDGDGKPDSGVTMHLKVGGQAMFHFMSFSAPYVIGPENTKLYWFDAEEMKPLITSPGHVKAINALVELSKHGPEAMFGWALGESWNYFLQGKAALTFTWGDLGALAQETVDRGGKSLVKGKTASAPIPGTTEYYNVASGAAVTTEAPNLVGNTTGGSWAPVLSKFAKSPEATYYLMALLATTAKLKTDAARGFDGVDPGATFQFPPPNGTGDIQEYIKAGWDEQDAKDYTAAYFENYGNKLQFPYLRIPGTFEYWLALDTHLSEAVTGAKSPEDALKATATDFEDITERLGREDQLKSYKNSLGL
jgi:multiple sugar transport system substrate-binding protein